MIRSIIRLYLAAMILLPMASWGALENENLLFSLPQNYKIGFQKKEGNMIMTELIPQKESINEWTEMVTAQIFLGLKTLSLVEFRSRMQTLWEKSCQGAQFAPVTQGEENGYSFMIWIQTCPLNKATGKPENTWFKAIQGNDSFYVVQKAFKYNPTKEEVIDWMNYFKSVKVCDSRLPERACAPVK